MNGLCEDSVAIDSNVFIHLLNPANNAGQHIDALLGALAIDKLALLVDDGNYIGNEYDEQVRPIIEDADDIGIAVQLLRYWMLSAERITVPVASKKVLLQDVKQIIHEKYEHADRRFVCVAFLCGKPLITNDRLHILNGPEKERGGPKGSPRYVRLVRIAKKHKLVGLLHTSEEAASMACAEEE